MCGDDDAARNGGETAKGTEELGVPTSGLEQTAGVAEARSDRQSVANSGSEQFAGLPLP